MAVRAGTRPNAREARLVRFDKVERLTHWSTAALFAVLILTGVALYFPSVGSLVGRRHLVAQIHIWTGVALPVPILLALVGPWGTRFRQDVRRINLWTPKEIRWLRTLGRSGGIVDKFNPGQKLNAIFIAGTIVVMFATGFVLEWFGFFPLGWRTGATFVHDVFALAVSVVIVGHVLFAVTHRDALRSMLTGWITENWARTHALVWFREQRRSIAQTTRPEDG
jgi:formate dehydrogenase subunit gamma